VLTALTHTIDAAMASIHNIVTDLRHTKPLHKLIDEAVYRTIVLRSPPDLSEDELDHRLELEAQVLEIQCPPPSVDRLTSSISATTIASGSQKPSSAISQSTGLTSSASSERRHTFQLPVQQPPFPTSPTRSVTPSLYSFTEKKASAFRDGFRKMAGFRKRRSITSSRASTPTSTEQQADILKAVDDGVGKEIMESPISTTSRKSSWSQSIPPLMKIPSEEPLAEDDDAIKRTAQCREIQELQSQHQDERERFLAYQKACLAAIRSEYETSKKRRMEAQAIILREARTKV
jgi:hypothetical protein